MSKRKSPRQTASLIIRPVDLPAKQRALIQIATPEEFIKVRPGKGGKEFRYIEGGYVIARLNQIFSPIGWDFNILNQQIEPGEVIIRGRLEIKDFKTGFTIGKTRTGTKERVAGIALGDTIKAAETDALKKCASHFGIGLDVYWQQLDEDKLTEKVSKKENVPMSAPSRNASTPETKVQLMKFSLEKIKSETDPTILTQYYERTTKSSLYTKQQKATLIKAIAEQRKKTLNGNQNQAKMF